MELLSNDQKAKLELTLQMCYLDMQQGASGDVCYDTDCFNSTGDNIELVFDMLVDCGILNKKADINKALLKYEADKLDVEIYEFWCEEAATIPDTATKFDVTEKHVTTLINNQEGN